MKGYWPRTEDAFIRGRVGAGMGETGTNHRQPAPTGADIRFELRGVPRPVLAPREPGARAYNAVSAWRMPPGIYTLSITQLNGQPIEDRRILLGDRRQRRREVDADSLLYAGRPAKPIVFGSA